MQTYIAHAITVNWPTPRSRTLFRIRPRKARLQVPAVSAQSVSAPGRWPCTGMQQGVRLLRASGCGLSQTRTMTPSQAQAQLLARPGPSLTRKPGPRDSESQRTGSDRDSKARTRTVKLRPCSMSLDAKAYTMKLLRPARSAAELRHRPG
jgi:hypothetical protein